MKKDSDLGRLLDDHPQTGGQDQRGMRAKRVGCAMELARPGYHELIRGGIATEAEAENLARRDPSSGRPATPEA